MKRIIIAAVLLIFVVIIYCYTYKSIENYYNTQVIRIEKTIKYIEKSKKDAACTEINNLINNKSLAPIIYKSDLENIYFELSKAKNYLMINDEDAALAQMLVCKDLITDIHNDNQFTIEKFY